MNTTNPIQLVSGLEAASSEHLLIIRFLDGIYFSGEDREINKELCRIAIDRVVAQELHKALGRFIEENKLDESEHEHDSNE